MGCAEGVRLGGREGWWAGDHRAACWEWRRALPRGVARGTGRNLGVQVARRPGRDGLCVDVGIWVRGAAAGDVLGRGQAPGLLPSPLHDGTACNACLPRPLGSPPFPLHARCCLPQINEVVRMAPVRRQTMLFSATMTEEVKKLVALSLKHPVR